MPAPDQNQTLREAGPILFWRAFHGCALVAKDGLFIAANDQFCSLVGYSHQEIVRLRFQDITAPVDVSRDSDQADRVADGSITSYEMKKSYIHKDGSTVNITLRVDAIRDDGKFVCFLAQTTAGTECSIGSPVISLSSLKAVKVLAFLRANWPMMLWLVTGVAAFFGYVFGNGKDK